MIYVILSFIALLLAIAFCVSLYMYFQDKRHTPSSHPKRNRKAPNIPSYELSSWIDDEVAKRKLYKKADSSVANLADELGISERRLKHTIYNAHSKTVTEYLNDRRIQAACRLLREQPEMTLDEISFETGFPSLKTFQTVFKNTMGQNPEQYRNMISRQKIDCFA